MAATFATLGAASGPGTGVKAGSAGVAGVAAGVVAGATVAVWACAPKGAKATSGSAKPKEITAEAAVEAAVEPKILEIMFCTMRPFTN